MRPVDPREINRCVVIGNGPSRKLTPLEQIKWPTFGCNQIYKDFQPNYLLAQDKAVLIIKQGLVDHSFVADPEINLASVMIKLARL